MKLPAFLFFIFLTAFGCKGQKPLKHMHTENINPLLCDIETGVCEMPGTSSQQNAAPIKVENKPLKVIYYTDPICSSCWGIEPQLRKLKLEYGHLLEIEYRMGGLLPDWSYNSGGISKPSDVAHHWDEVSHYYDMPIDGDVWLEDPLASSYPPSIAFKAAEMQDKEKAIKFLRELREMVFLQKKNIAKWEHIATAAQAVGLNVEQLQQDFNGPAKELFTQDLELGRKLGVRGFPTMFFVENTGTQEKVYGTKPYSVYEAAILKLQPKATKTSFDKNWQALFKKHNTLTSREFAELSGIARQESDSYLQKLADEGYLDKVESKNGVMWVGKKD